jgi:hypothetical protein
MEDGMREALILIGLDPDEVIERERGDDFCAECAHFHPEGQACLPDGPCGDYRCCIN